MPRRSPPEPASEVRLPPSATHDELVADCRETAHALFAILSRAGGPELLSLDLTMGQFKAMATVTMYGPQPVGELGRRLGISEPAASLLADRLVELELAVRERDPEDRRRTLVTATAAAQELAARLRQGGREQFATWLTALEDTELECLSRGLQALLRASQDLPPAPHPGAASASSGDAHGG
jgi:DNA-binding MarR family transcriptional regulator